MEIVHLGKHALTDNAKIHARTLNAVLTPNAEPMETIKRDVIVETTITEIHTSDVIHQNVQKMKTVLTTWLAETNDVNLHVIAHRQLFARLIIIVQLVDVRLVTQEIHK